MYLFLPLCSTESNYCKFFIAFWIFIEGVKMGCRNKVQWNRVHGNKVHVFFIARIRSMPNFLYFLRTGIKYMVEVE